MNYKTSLLAIFASYLITLNVGADCCFTQPPVNLPPLTHPCIQVANFDTCNDTPNRVGYLNDNARCSIDGFTCCVQGESGFIIEGKRVLVPVETPPDCEPDSKAIRLDIVIDYFTADPLFLINSNDNRISLKGRIINSESMALLYIWRAQIEEDGYGSGAITNSTRIGDEIQIGEGPFSFSEIDSHPQNGVNYYALMHRDMNGKPTIHCDHIPHVVVGNGTPNPKLAKKLCKEINLSILLHVFEP